MYKFLTHENHLFGQLFNLFTRIFPEYALSIDHTEGGCIVIVY